MDTKYTDSKRLDTKYTDSKRLDTEPSTDNTEEEDMDVPQMDVPQMDVRPRESNNTSNNTPNNTKEYKNNWSAKRREHWNAYMRNYNAKKKQQHIEQLGKITIEYHNSIKSYDKTDVIQILYDTINIYGTILDIYIDHLPRDAADKIRATYSKNNIVESINILQKYIKYLLQK